MKMRSSKVAYIWWKDTVVSRYASHIVYFVKLFVSLFEDDDDSDDSGSDVEVKKHGRRHKLLKHKLSLSEGESGDEKATSKDKKNKGGKKKSGRRG